MFVEDPDLRLVYASERRYRTWPCEPLDADADIVVRRDPMTGTVGPPEFVGVAEPERSGDRGTAHVAGQVVRSDGRPLPGVVVGVYAEDPAEDDVSGMRLLAGATTNADGRFHVRDLPGDRFALRVHPSGVGYYISEGVRNIAAGAEDAHLVARPTWFESGLWIRGTLRGPDGGPVAGATVVARPAGFRAEAREDRTGEDGAFVIMGVKPGPWRLFVIEEGRERAVAGSVICGATGVSIR